MKGSRDMRSSAAPDLGFRHVTTMKSIECSSPDSALNSSANAFHSAWHRMSSARCASRFPPSLNDLTTKRLVEAAVRA